MQDKRGPNTRAVHGGRSLDVLNGAVAPPIAMSTTFARDERGELLGDFLYGRHDNPNRRALEKCLADLEGAEDAMAFASGCAVAHAVSSALGAHDRLIVGDDLYFGIRILLRRLAERGHFELREIDLRDAAAFEAARERPRGRLVVMAETPTNPLMRVVDIAALADRVHAAGGELVVDNTMATPVLQKPLELGADYVMHSTTKFVGGHSDVIGGALLCRNASSALWKDIAEVRQVGGGVPSPFDCWLLLRSLSTVVLRVERQAENAQALAEMLAAHPAVERVLYPGLPTHPEHEVASAQMRRPGAMLSVLLAGGEDAAAAFVGGLRLITVATSLGGVHTLAEHRARIEGPQSSTPRNLVRMSVGIEDLADLERDVAGALGSL
jgi:cystathionine gamma-synthase